ncbi:hypothetical protein K402DRAFT_416941 [Aulographum hederae CBS 113979]|uniref:GmrSD restriction endonucleases N-terminal domain-containing protein n=1 Tax=Aulographum hederae CBS 113979 TaxID=1176131 RepID=A0A6G1HES8_9PEZI|nr:hypothetical protein K402DRAFT_416941 [Aulographum hederae CBS 113979]
MAQLSEDDLLRAPEDDSDATVSARGDDDEDAGYDLDNIDDGTFVPRPKLPDHETARYTISQVDALLLGEYLDLDPEYQRGVIWSEAQMSGLIDSILDNFYVPPVIFNKKKVITPSGGVRWKRTCVDGKQRLSSVKAFMAGKIPCHDRLGRKFYFCHDTDSNQDHRRKRILLPQAVKDEFLQKELICIEIMDLDPVQEEDLFARVQKGVQLSKEEQMWATTGPWQELAKDFIDRYKTVISLSDRRRAKGFGNVLYSFAQIIEALCPPDDSIPRARLTAKYGLELFSYPERLDEELKAHLKAVFRAYQQLVAYQPDIFKSKTFSKVKSFAPVEFVAVAVLISQYHDMHDYAALAKDIRAMREELRLKFTDLRKNAPTWAIVWDFISKHKDAAANGTTESSVQSEPPNASVTVQEHAEVIIIDDSSNEDVSKFNAKKRKRTNEEGESDELREKKSKEGTMPEFDLASSIPPTTSGAAPPLNAPGHTALFNSDSPAEPADDVKHERSTPAQVASDVPSPSKDKSPWSENSSEDEFTVRAPRPTNRIIRAAHLRNKVFVNIKDRLHVAQQKHAASMDKLTYRQIDGGTMKVSSIWGPRG